MIKIIIRYENMQCFKYLKMSANPTKPLSCDPLKSLILSLVINRMWSWGIDK
jgi:hypothetical protein